MQSLRILLILSSVKFVYSSKFVSLQISYVYLWTIDLKYTHTKNDEKKKTRQIVVFFFFIISNCFGNVCTILGMCIWAGGSRRIAHWTLNIVACNASVKWTIHAVDGWGLHSNWLTVPFDWLIGITMSERMRTNVRSSQALIMTFRNLPLKWTQMKMGVWNTYRLTKSKWTKSSRKITKNSAK